MNVFLMFLRPVLLAKSETNKMFINDRIILITSKDNSFT